MDMPFHPPVPLEFYGFSSLDRYFGQVDPELPLLAATGSDPAVLAKKVDAVSFPGVPRVDAEAQVDGRTVLFRCADDWQGRQDLSVPVMDFRYVPERRVFRDPSEVYYLLREGNSRIRTPFRCSWLEAADLAVLASRYGFSLPEVGVCEPSGPPLPGYLQRLYLVFLLTGKNPAAGLTFLKKTGFIREHWPLLDLLDRVDHSKEYHPEGNVWQHTLETFSYRKTRDLVLSLSLLLHDIGKVKAVENEGNRFDRHAQIGGSMAMDFLKDLSFDPALTEEVRFLVSRHMMPAMVARLPVFRTEETMNDPLFPLLLEVYRCDISSTFRGPDGYYEACRVYREFLKNRKNPFRTSAGKKIFRTYVE
ncbi:MAG: HD domain-containing protein [Spirochaetales bacterium]|nr:HD domain-containing protein [Spirochaetales bacterium]